MRARATRAAAVGFITHIREQLSVVVRGDADSEFTAAATAAAAAANQSSQASFRQVCA